MKTIAVLADFSESSVHATRFAVHMAKKMKARVLLFSLNAVTAPKQLQMAGGHQDMFDFGAGSELADFAIKTELEMADRYFPGSYLPEVTFDSNSSELEDVMTSIAHNNEIALVITAPTGNADLATFMLSDACTRMIDWAAVPVMVIPHCAAVRNFEKMAFATTLHEEDIHSIAELGALMEAFTAELMVAHLNEDPDNLQIRDAEQKLNRDLYKRLNCGGVYFRSIADNKQYKDWNWLNANKKTELLALMQHPREQMTKFFTRGQNPHATHHITVPVMVLPKRP
ncbi:MAG: universal stress protein [Mucilaginibacter sp.]